MRLLQAPGLQLEPLVAAHAAELFGPLSDPAIYQFENGPPESEAALALRYALLESRGPADGSELWLNWALRRADGRMAGYLQATVWAPGQALVAYELASAHWRQGLGSVGVQAMLDELASAYGVHLAVAVYKRPNFRSEGLLRKLGFGPLAADTRLPDPLEPDEAGLQRVL